MQEIQENEVVEKNLATAVVWHWSQKACSDAWTKCLDHRDAVTFLRVYGCWQCSVAVVRECSSNPVCMDETKVWDPGKALIFFLIGLIVIKVVGYVP